METTFISIHDLSGRATILYSSDSVIDILGYTPDEIVNRSAWDFFSLDELPYAREFHQKRIESDKAAVLAYCSIKDRTGQMVGCECCFTIVYDVMVVCTSIYKRSLESEKRAAEAPMVRRIFSSSPNDPRYHMLSHLSAKFSQPSKWQQHEPRAALFLNRFTRTLSIMYATNGLQDVIGISAESMRGRSFYYCISENCLSDAVKCLENAKGNDSIAYLRFWFRDPRLEDEAQATESDSDEEMQTDMSATDASEDGGVHLQSDHASPGASMDVDRERSKSGSRNSSGTSTRGTDTHEAIFGQSRAAHSSTSSLANSPARARSASSRREGEQIELEAVISCTSDGLVVCLRRARPMIPHPAQPPSRPVYQNGMFAAPWATNPIVPPLEARAGAGFGTTFAPSLAPQGARRNDHTVPPARAAADTSDFMNAIRDQAIFAWALTGINGSLAAYSSGKPMGDAVPQDGLPIWASDPRLAQNSDSGGQNTDPYGWPGTKIFGDPGLDKTGNSGSRGLSSNSSSTGGTPFPPPTR